jgi:ParB/RepB/Spo0J family partition protein
MQMTKHPTLDIRSLKPHPLSARIYGAQEPLDGMVESVKQYGIITPITITHAKQIVSGHRRYGAAKAAGLCQVPIVYFPSDDKFEIEIAVIEANRHREKSNEQKANEYVERVRIESELAKRNQQAAGGDRKSNEHKKSLEANLPQAIPERAPQARELAAAPVGWGARTAEKAAKVVEYIKQSGDNTMTALLNKSVNSAYAVVKQKTGDGPKPPPFNPQYSNVWNFPRLTEGFGEKYPGNIPGDIIRNLIWYYTRDGDRLVDPFAGGGVTMDVCSWWNGQPGVWRVRNLNYDLVPSRKGIKKLDVTEPPYLPDETKDASMVFLDPPYWRQRRGDYSAHATNLANLPLPKFHAALARVAKAAHKNLQTGGHLALIIGSTQDSGVFVDHTAHMLAQAESMGFSLVQRIIVPYTTQQFSAVDVAQARKSKMMLKGYRDLLIWRKRQ